MTPQASGPIWLYCRPLSMLGAKVQIAALKKCLGGELIVMPFSMALPYQPKKFCGASHQPQAGGAGARRA